jgi:hypothetical protein
MSGYSEFTGTAKPPAAGLYGTKKWSFVGI